MNRILLGVCVLGLFWAPAVSSGDDRLDLVLKGGRIVDGCQGELGELRA